LDDSLSKEGIPVAAHPVRELQKFSPMPYQTLLRGEGG
jgi:hypothetical protein